MLVRNILSDKIDIPHEPGQWMQFRRLNGRRLAACVEKRQEGAMSRMKTLGADGMAIIRDAAKGREEAAVVADPLDQYDRDTLLISGVASWSYEADPKSELESEDGGLDPITSEWAARQILKFNDLIPADAETKLGN